MITKNSEEEGTVFNRLVEELKQDSNLVQEQAEKKNDE